MTLSIAIKEAMIKAGYNQKRLAEKCGMHPSALSRIIKGQRLPTAECTRKIESVLGSLVVHTRLDLVDGLMPLVRGQSLYDLPEASRGQVLDDENDTSSCEDALGMASYSNINLVQPLEATGASAELAARKIRASCEAGTITFADIVSLMDFLRVRVHIVPMRKVAHEKPRGMVFYNYYRRVLSIVVDSGGTPERQVFQIAYCLGAACLCLSLGREDIEDSGENHAFIKTFAAEFLMPYDSVISVVANTGIANNRWTLKRACAIKTRFNVSAEAMIWRLKEVGRMSEELAKKLADEAHDSFVLNKKEPEPRLAELKGRQRLMLLREAAHDIVT